MDDHHVVLVELWGTVANDVLSCEQGSHSQKWDKIGFMKWILTALVINVIIYEI